MRVWKTCLLALALGLVVATPMFGQRAARSRSMLGISAGATTSDIEGGFLNTSSQWGFIGGIFGTFRTSYNSMVGLEANYVQKGGGGEVDLSYIDVPFIIGAVIPTDNDALNFNFYTGIGIGFKVGCSQGSDSDERLACDRAKSTEWNWPLGLAFAFRSQSGKYFGLDGRYSVGISDAFEGSSARNRSWQFKALFGVPIG